MNLIQTYFNFGTHAPLFNRDGWLSAELNWMSWSLSCLQLNKLFGSVHLYCNKRAKEVLIDQLELPYSKVTICEEMEFSPKLWAYSKILTYSLQREAFLHVDGDVFIWEPFNRTLLDGSLIAQNIEFDTGYYKKLINEDIDRHNFTVPAYMQEIQQRDGMIRAYNAGILGGHDIAFYKEYCSTALQIISDNRDKIELLANPGGLNVFMEQQLFYCLSQRDQKKVDCYFKDPIDSHGYQLSNFQGVPATKNYLHIIGKGKSDNDTCDILAKWLRHEYPVYFNRIINKCRAQRISTYIQPQFPPGIQPSKTLLKTIAQLKGDIRPVFNQEYQLLKDSYTGDSEAIHGIIKDLNMVQEARNRLHNEIPDASIGELEHSNFLTSRLIGENIPPEFIHFLVNPYATLLTFNYDIDNLPDEVEPGDHLVVLVPNTLTETIDDIFCDELTTCLLEFMKYPIPFSALLQSSLELFETKEVETATHELRDLLVMKLNYLLKHNVVLAKQTNQ